MKLLSLLLLNLLVFAKENNEGVDLIQQYEYYMLGMIVSILILLILYIVEKKKGTKMTELKKEIEKLRDDLNQKEKELAQRGSSQMKDLENQIINYEQEVAKLKTKLDDKNTEVLTLEAEQQALQEKLDSTTKSYTEKIEDYETSRSKEKNNIDKIIDFTTKKFDEYTSKKDKIDKLEEENRKIKLKNQYLENQYINIDSVSYIEELSLLKIKMKTKEFFEEQVGEKDKNGKFKEKNLYRGLFDIEFTMKLGFDLKNTKYKINNKRIDIYNIKLKNNSIEGYPKIKPLISEIRKFNKNLFGDDGTWEIDTEDVKYKDYQHDYEELLQKKIAESSDYTQQFEDVYYKAVKSYFQNLIGNGFEIILHKEDNKNALSYQKCFEIYNKSINNKKLKEKEDIINIPKKDEIINEIKEKAENIINA